jgi:hypothetical protein
MKHGFFLLGAFALVLPPAWTLCPAITHLAGSFSLTSTPGGVCPFSNFLLSASFLFPA